MSGEMQKKPLHLEEAFQQIEEIIDKMETQDVTLEESFSLYQQGIQGLKECSRMLDAVEKKMEIMKGEGEENGYQDGT